MADPQNQQRQDNRPNMVILYDAPIKGDGVWEINTWIVVTRGSHPVNGALVRLFCSGQEVTSETTNEDGRTNPFTVIVPANSIRIQLEAFADTSPQAKDKKTVTLSSGQQPSPSKELADDWKISATGNDGRYNIHIFVISKDRMPVSGVLVVALNKNIAESLAEARTDNDGRVILTIPEFTQDYCDITVEALGTKFVPKNLRLYGPMEENKPPEVPDLPELDQNLIDWKPLNTLRLMWRAWKEGGKAKNEHD